MSQGNEYSKLIIFNKIFGVIEEEKNFFLSERRDEKWLLPIFDLNNKNWCILKKSKNGNWFILFYKQTLENNEKNFYISFAKESFSNEISFNYFKKIENGSDDEKWMKKI